MHLSLQRSMGDVSGLRVTRRPPQQRAAKCPLVSVVVPTLNAAAVLDRTLASIARQRWPAIETIVVDGGSTDGTVELIRRHPLVIAWVSAPDGGIAHAFNRGIALSTGELIQIINAGDLLGDDQIAHAVAALRAHPKAGFVFGDVVIRDADWRPTRRSRGRPGFHSGPFDSMVVAPHPSLCVRRAAYERVGLYSTEFRLTMDFDWLARCAGAGIHGVHSPRILAEMAEGGMSNRHAFTRDWENFRVVRRHRTMPLGPALLRLALKMGMNAIRALLVAAGGDTAGYAFRGWVDRRLGRT